MRKILGECPDTNHHVWERDSIERLSYPLVFLATLPSGQEVVIPWIVDRSVRTKDENVNSVCFRPNFYNEAQLRSEVGLETPISRDPGKLRRFYTYSNTLRDEIALLRFRWS